MRDRTQRLLRMVEVAENGASVEDVISQIPEDDQELNEFQTVMLVRLLKLAKRNHEAIGVNRKGLKMVTLVAGLTVAAFGLHISLLEGVNPIMTMLSMLPGAAFSLWSLLK